MLCARRWGSNIVCCCCKCYLSIKSDRSRISSHTWTALTPLAITHPPPPPVWAFPYLQILSFLLLLLLLLLLLVVCYSSDEIPLKIIHNLVKIKLARHESCSFVTWLNSAAVYLWFPPLYPSVVIIIICPGWIGPFLRIHLINFHFNYLNCPRDPLHKNELCMTQGGTVSTGCCFTFTRQKMSARDEMILLIFIAE